MRVVRRVSYDAQRIPLALKREEDTTIDEMRALVTNCSIGAAPAIERRSAVSTCDKGGFDTLKVVLERVTWQVKVENFVNAIWPCKFNGSRD